MLRLEEISKKIYRKLISNWIKASYVLDFLLFLTHVKFPN